MRGATSQLILGRAFLVRLARHGLLGLVLGGSLAIGIGGYS